VLNKINNQLFNHFEATQTGEVFIAPFDIYFDNESNVVQPDIIVILKGNDIIKPDGYAHGVPDLLIEILSPGNRDHDLVKKKNLYEKFGVKEYWIVDPTSKHCLGFVLSNSKYNLISENTGEIFLQLLQMKITF
jgi:Uma2 family endonuclease